MPGLITQDDDVPHVLEACGAAAPVSMQPKAKAGHGGGNVAAGTGGGRSPQVAGHLTPPTTLGATGINDGTLHHGADADNGAKHPLGHPSMGACVVLCLNTDKVLSNKGPAQYILDRCKAFNKVPHHQQGYGRMIHQQQRCGQAISQEGS